MPRRSRLKWYVGAGCAAAVLAASGGVALAAQSGPSYSSGPSVSGPGTVSGPEGHFVQASGSGAPAAPAGSTTYSSKASGSGKTTKSHSTSASKASVRHSADAAGPSLHSSDSGSGPGTVNGPEGQFVAGNGATAPTAPAGSTSYSSKGSGSGKTTKSHSGN